jgi:hypothetical protein
MADGRCEICNGRAIGVACTIMPYSVAYCAECCRRFAQPAVVFETFYDDVGTDFERLADGIADLETFSGGKYITYRQWAQAREARGE